MSCQMKSDSQCYDSDDKGGFYNMLLELEYHMLFNIL